MIKVNEGVLRRAVANIELNLHQWDQGMWVGENFCGTTACLAGWIVLTEKGIDFDELFKIDERDDETVLGPDNLYQIPSQACDLLGLAETGDRVKFANDVFYTVVLETPTGVVDLYQSPEALKLFKEHLTEVTGVEF